MIAERRQYVIFRLSILSAAALFVVGVAIATRQLYQAASVNHHGFVCVTIAQPHDNRAGLKLLMATG
jgi:hypothetical protein